MRILGTIATVFIVATLVVATGCSCCSRSSATPWAAQRAAGMTAASEENARLDPMAYPWVAMAPADGQRVASR